MAARLIAAFAIACLGALPCAAATYDVTVPIPDLNHFCGSFGDDPHAGVGDFLGSPVSVPWALPKIEPGDTVIVHIVPAAGGVFRVNTSYPGWSSPVYFNFYMDWSNNRSLFGGGTAPMTVDFVNLTGATPVPFSGAPVAFNNGSDLTIIGHYYCIGPSNVEFSEARCTVSVVAEAPAQDLPNFVLTPSSASGYFTFGFSATVPDPGFGNPDPCVNVPPVAWSGVQPGNTQPGTNVSVTSADNETTVTFGTVTAPGETTITSSVGLCTAGGDFSVQQGAINALSACYHIETTATISGTILVSITYTPPASGPGHANASIWHIPAGQTTAVKLTTVSTQTLANGDIEITAQTPSLSPFFVGYPALLDHLTVGAFAAPMGKTKKLGATMPLKLALFGDGTPITTQAQLDAFLASYGAPAGCPEVQVYTAADLKVALDESSTCFQPDTDSNWHFNLKLDSSFAPGTYEVQVQIGGSAFAPGNRFFTAK
jgi:hypothetical protein